MPDQPATVAEVQASLHVIARVLRTAPHLTPETRLALAELLEELAGTLGSALPPAEMAHLTDRAAGLLQALQRPHDEGVLTAARERLDEAVVGAEVRAPLLTGVIRRLLDALAQIGI
jgi:hypothetical protein